MNLKTLSSLVKDTLSEWWDDNATQLAAALAFYTVFSFAPILIIAIAVASMVFGRETVREEVVTQFQSIAGAVGARVLQVVLDQARQQSLLATTLGAGTMLFGATVVFAALQDVLNTIWGVMVKPGNTVKVFFQKRFLSFLLVLGIGLLLLVSVIASAMFSAVGSLVDESFPIPLYLVEMSQFVVSFVMVTFLFAVIYKVLPDVKISWSDVWIGAAATSLLFNIGKTVIGFYLVNSSVGSAYGAAGSLVLLLVWIYYSAQVFFLGAEFTQVYARWRGSPIEPDQNAVRFTRTIHAEE